MGTCNILRLIKRPDEQVYRALFTKCIQLQVLSLTFDRFDSESPDEQQPVYRLGWERLLSLLPHIPRSVHLIIIQLDSFEHDIRLLHSAKEVLPQFECAVMQRRPQTRVSVRPSDSPIFDLDEQRQIRQVFPRLSNEAMLEF